MNKSFNFVEVNKKNQVFKAQANRLVNQSKFWNFYNSQKIKINNFGFRNDNNYSRSEKNIIAVIGDSYVEAVQVPFEKTFFNILDESLGNEYKVYSFGFSGAPLSQYLKWAEFAIQNFDVKYLIFNVVSNDFYESIYEWKDSPGFHYFKKCDDDYKEYCLYRENLNENSFQFLKESSFFSYLIYNLDLINFVNNFQSLFKNLFDKDKSIKYFSNVPYKVSNQKMSDSKLAINLFFKNLATLGMPKDKIISIVDGRFYSKKEEYKDSFFSQIREFFFIQSNINNYNYIDLSEEFDKDFNNNKRKFEFSRDSHWNELGHFIVGKTLIDYYNKIIKY